MAKFYLGLLPQQLPEAQLQYVGQNSIFVARFLPHICYLPRSWSVIINRTAVIIYTSFIEYGWHYKIKGDWMGETCSMHG
jgi:hypothetical protein